MLPATVMSGSPVHAPSPNQIGNGTMLPEVSVDQYAATMARWFGVPDAQLHDLFPNLVNFDAGVRDLGFMA